MIHNQNDFDSWEGKVVHTDLETPFGPEIMMPVKPEKAVGVLACVYGLATEIDDQEGSSQVDDRVEEPFGKGYNPEEIF